MVHLAMMTVHAAHADIFRNRQHLRFMAFLEFDESGHPHYHAVVFVDPTLMPA